MSWKAWRGGALACVVCLEASQKVSSKGQSPRLKTQMTSPPPTAAIGGPEERATFFAVSRLVPSGTQEQVSKLENLLRVGLGKGGNGIPGDSTGRWQWLHRES